MEHLASDPDGPWHSESWNYASAVGMLMYLASNAHPEIQFAVHQCAMFTHCPHKCHTTVIKHIGHYLKGILTTKLGLILKPEGTLQLDCYVDASFSGLWGYEDDQDPVIAHSHTVYVMTLGDSQFTGFLSFRSKLHSQPQNVNMLP